MTDLPTPRRAAEAAVRRSMRSCDRCLARTWLIERLAPHLEPVRARIAEVLALEDHELLAAVGGEHADEIALELDGFVPDLAREQALRSGVGLICQCAAAYPADLRALGAAPATLHVTGGLDRFLELAADDLVAIVGSRRASPYGLEVARKLGRDLARSGITVVSGMALGIDSAAHAGALLAGGPTVAVLGTGAQQAYPPAKRALYAQIKESGAVISELPGAGRVWRWMFPARNRLIAALGAMTLVVEARERSGALLTARFAGELARPVGAVPGRVTAPTSAGSNALLADGAHVICRPQDVLDLLYGAGARAAPTRRKPRLAAELEVLLEAISEGNDTAGALERARLGAEQGLAALVSLELAGYIRREAGGRFSVIS